MANRKRGAQPGNLNALKHGFYSRNFLDLENTDLEAMLAQDLESEIAMLRVVVRRAFELSTAPDRSQSPLEGDPPQSPLKGDPPQSPLKGGRIGGGSDPHPNPPACRGRGSLSRPPRM